MFGCWAPAPKRSEKITVSATLKNLSNVEGTETVQLYLRDLFATAVRPVKELCGFKKVQVKAGDFRLFIGGSSEVFRICRV